MKVRIKLPEWFKSKENKKVKSNQDSISNVLDIVCISMIWIRRIITYILIPGIIYYFIKTFLSDLEKANIPTNATSQLNTVGSFATPFSIIIVTSVLLTAYLMFRNIYRIFD